MTHRVTVRQKQYYLKSENMIILDADKELKKFIGMNLLTLINVCAIKGYTFEKL